MRPEAQPLDAALLSRPANHRSDGLGHQSLSAGGGTEPVADSPSVAEPDGHRADHDTVIATDRERPLVRLAPGTLDRVEEGAAVLFAVRHRDEWNEARDVRILARVDDRVDVVPPRLSQNETLGPNLHV